MKRLRENALIYGRLFTVDRPHLVERYNKALQAFRLPPTGLDTFDIDRTGFSPQVAAELGEFDYLDPAGVNRRFIVLTPAQASLPVVHTRFSNTGGLMHEFYTANARAIHALTIKDVLFGEIEDNVSAVADIEDLLSIEQVEFKVLSAHNVLAKAAELRTLVDRLKTEPDAWRDDAMLERMVALAQTTGDIRSNRLVPDQVVFRHPAFWTSHFGGTYVFAGDKMTTIICDPKAPGFRRSRPWQVSYLDRNDHDRVFDFLSRSGRIDPPDAAWLEDGGFLDHRIDLTLKGLMHELDPDADLMTVDPVFMQTFLARRAGAIRADGVYPFLNGARRELARTGRIDIRDVPGRLRFQVVRARPDHPDTWLTNRLLSDYVPRDVVARYVFNKQGFYADYEGWSEPWRAFVVETLKSTYLTGKRALRARLFGLR